MDTGTSRTSEIRNSVSIDTPKGRVGLSIFATNDHDLPIASAKAFWVKPLNFRYAKPSNNGLFCVKDYCNHGHIGSYTLVTPQGKQMVKQLIGQNQGVSNIEITDPSIKEFEKIARKYGVDYAVKKDRSRSPPKYLIFFKGWDADALTAAFTEYTGKKVRKAEKSERPSVLAKLSQFKELVKHAVVDRNKRKELER